MNAHKAIRGLMLAMVASIAFYLVMVVLGDWNEVVTAFAEFDPLVFLYLCALSIACYVLRGLRWGWMMRFVGHPVGSADALFLQFAGQTMSVSPGRIGELLKPWLARDIGGMPMSKGVSLAFSERVADLIAVCILALGGLSVLGGGAWMYIAGSIAVVLGTVVAGSRRFHDLALRVLGRSAWMSKHTETLACASDAMCVALEWRKLLPSVMISVVAWGLEGVGFWLCGIELGFSAFGVFGMVSVYAVSTLVGAFTFLPGGIGLTEASMAGILIAFGMSASGASTATLITRVATLWLGVGLGWIVLLARPGVLKGLMGREDLAAEDDV